MRCQILKLKVSAAKILTFKGNKNRNGQILGVAVHDAQHKIASMDTLVYDFKGNKSKTGTSLGQSNFKD